MFFHKNQKFLVGTVMLISAIYLASDGAFSQTLDKNEGVENDILIQGILQNLAKAEQNATALKKEQERKKASDELSKTLMSAAANARINVPQKRESAGQVDALRLHIGRCWKIPHKSFELPDKEIEVLAELNNDGTFNHLEIRDRNKNPSSETLMLWESVLGALTNCGPLPIKGYEGEVIFSFSTRYLKPPPKKSN